MESEASPHLQTASISQLKRVCRHHLHALWNHPFGRLGELFLRGLYGAHYSIQACFTGCEKQEAGGFRHTFESQGDAEVRAPAIQRHGVGGVAAALLLDALNDGKKRE
jgi:hypothetical protein